MILLVPFEENSSNCRGGGRGRRGRAASVRPQLRTITQSGSNYMQHRPQARAKPLHATSLIFQQQANLISKALSNLLHVHLCVCVCNRAKVSNYYATVCTVALFRLNVRTARRQLAVSQLWG